MSLADTHAPPTAEPAVLRYAAFTRDPAGGNPAGVVLDAAGLDEATMLAVAARLGYSETAFLTPPPAGSQAPEGVRAYRARYFSPQAEVPFCGHATVATAVALGERHGTGEYLFHTQAGPVPVTVDERDGALRATLTGVPRTPRSTPRPTSPRRWPPSAGTAPTSMRPSPRASPTPAPATWCWPPPPAIVWPGSTTTSSGCAR